jgi:ABC-type uncharacterized transport system YnjBCD permease subunit
MFLTPPMKSLSSVLEAMPDPPLTVMLTPWFTAQDAEAAKGPSIKALLVLLTSSTGCVTWLTSGKLATECAQRAPAPC